MSADPHSRVAEAVPVPESAEHLSEEQKQALEKSGEVEHQQGQQREDTAQKAQEQGR